LSAIHPATERLSERERTPILAILATLVVASSTELASSDVSTLAHASVKVRSVVSGCMTNQIVRVWKGYGTAEGADRYCREHFAKTVLPQLQALSGFLDANVLVHSLGDVTEVVVATVWESLDAIRAFAGDEYERAVVEPIVRDLLERFDDNVTHFTLAVGAHPITEHTAP
jgi:heme-degrading monooxygenase HmoA